MPSPARTSLIRCDSCGGFYPAGLYCLDCEARCVARWLRVIIGAALFSLAVILWFVF